MVIYSVVANFFKMAPGRHSARKSSKSSAGKRKFERSDGLVILDGRRHNVRHGGMHISKLDNMRPGGFEGMELKFYDTFLVNGVITSDIADGVMNPDATHCLNSLASGSGPSARIGRKATFQNIYVTGYIKSGAEEAQGAPGTTADYYIALVMDKFNNGATETSSGACYKNLATNIPILSMRDLDQSKRFQVLDRVHITGQQAPIAMDAFDTITTFAVAGTIEKFKLSWKGSFTTLYSDTTGATDAIVDNNISILCWCSSNARVPTLTYSARVRFTG